MTIQIGGHTFTSAEVIAAIQASDNQTTTFVSPYSSLDEVGGVLQSVLHRLAALEDRLPVTHTGFGITSTTANNVTTHRVQMLDPKGDTIIVTFEVPETT